MRTFTGISILLFSICSIIVFGYSFFSDKSESRTNRIRAHCICFVISFVVAALYFFPFQQKLPEDATISVVSRKYGVQEIEDPSLFAEVYDLISQLRYSRPIVDHNAEFGDGVDLRDGNCFTITLYDTAQDKHFQFNFYLPDPGKSIYWAVNDGYTYHLHDAEQILTELQTLLKEHFGFTFDKTPA